MALNMKSIIKSGLAAGLVINLSAVLMVPAVGDQMKEALVARNLPPLSTGAGVFIGSISFFLGIILVWLYAAIRPRFGSNMKTAMIAALLVWFLGYFFANISNAVMGFIPIRLTVIGTLWGLVELVTAALVGMLLYKETLPVEMIRS